MAKKILLVLFSILFPIIMGSACSSDRQCASFLLNYCCGSTCRSTPCPFTTNCVWNSDCPGARICCSSGDCMYNKEDCPIGDGLIAGLIIGLMVFIGVLTAVCCYMCACCPLHYSHRQDGRYIWRKPAFLASNTASVHPPPPAGGTQQPPVYPQDRYAVPPSRQSSLYSHGYSTPHQSYPISYKNQRPYSGMKSYPSRQPYSPSPNPT